MHLPLPPSPEYNKGQEKEEKRRTFFFHSSPLSHARKHGIFSLFKPYSCHSPLCRPCCSSALAAPGKRSSPSPCSWGPRKTHRRQSRNLPRRLSLPFDDGLGSRGNCITGTVFLFPSPLADLCHLHLFLLVDREIPSSSLVGGGGLAFHLSTRPHRYFGKGKEANPRCFFAAVEMSCRRHRHLLLLLLRGKSRAFPGAPSRFEEGELAPQTQQLLRNDTHNHRDRGFAVIN